MKLVVDIKGKLEENDILVFDGTQFKPVSKDDFLFKTKKENDKIKLELKQLESDVNTFKESVNKKLKEYHDILQVLTKEE